MSFSPTPPASAAGARGNRPATHHTARRWCDSRRSGRAGADCNASAHPYRFQIAHHSDDAAHPAGVGHSGNGLSRGSLLTWLSVPPSQSMEGWMPRPRLSMLADQAVADDAFWGGGECPVHRAGAWRRAEHGAGISRAGCGEPPTRRATPIAVMLRPDLCDLQSRLPLPTGGRGRVDAT